jgi:hypothetical protein
VNLTSDGWRTVAGNVGETLRVYDFESLQSLGGVARGCAGESNREFFRESAGRNFHGRSFISGTAATAPRRRHSDRATLATLRRFGLTALHRPLHRVRQGVRAAARRRRGHTGKKSEVRSQKSEVRGQKGELSCLDLPASTSADPRLLSACPHCQHALIFNPFIVDLSDEAHEASLRRGLAHCRQTPGDDASTLGHLAALAVHLEKMGKSAEAAEFQREHDSLAAKVRKKAE